MVPVAVPVPEAIEKAGAVEPAAGAVNLTVVAAVVPKAGTPAGNVKPVEVAVSAAVAAVAVAGVIVKAGASANAMTAAGASSLPPQAAREAAKTRLNTSLDVLEFIDRVEIMDKFPEIK